MTKAIFFDFDGVLVESVDIKSRAFAKLFEREGEEVVRKVVDYHLRHGGLSRYEKIRYYYDQILCRPLSDEQLDELADAFSRLVINEVVQAPYVKGALELLAALHDRIALYTISGTPEEELKDIIKRRHMDGYFKGVYGAPRKKGELVRMLMREQGYAANEVMFVGDALTDLEAARESGIPFIARLAEGTRNMFEGMDLPVIRDLTELRPL